MTARSRKPRKPRARTRPAQLVADAVSVLCPSCGEPQPNSRDGSEQWEIADFKAVADKSPIACVSCDAPMFVWSTPKVMFA